MSAIRDALTDLFNDELTDDEIIDIWNKYAGYNDKDYIYKMEDIEYILFHVRDMSLLDVLDNVSADFSSNDQYFTIDEQDGKIYSFTDWYGSYSPYNERQLLTSIIDDANIFGSEKVMKLLEDFNLF